MTTNKRTYNQYDADYMYVFILTGEVLNKNTYEDCQRIKATVKMYRDIILSTPASYKFWITASEWYNTKWLTIREADDGDMDILEYWDKFIDDWYTNNGNKE